MSLVICSNLKSDSPNEAQSSIFKPWSFRNALSSTMTIPANSQVALQSVKYNLNGTISLTNDSNIFYVMFSRILSSGAVTMDDCAGYPIRVEIDTSDFSTSVDPSELTARITTALQKKLYHPNIRGEPDVEVKTDAGTGEFLGFKFFTNQYNAGTNTIPSNAKALDIEDDDIRHGTVAKSWTYTKNSSTDGTLTTSEYKVEGQGCILVGNPLSAYNGEAFFDFTDANGKTLDWVVGLSRVCMKSHVVGTVNSCIPSYYNDLSDGWDMDFFGDYVVRRVNNELQLWCAVCNSNWNPDMIEMVEISYWLNPDATGCFSGLTEAYTMDDTGGASLLTKIKFVQKGQYVVVEAYNVSGELQGTMVDYNGVLANKTYNSKLVAQTCWDLHPFMVIETTEAEPIASLTLEKFHAVTNFTGYKPWTGTPQTATFKPAYDKGSWWNEQEGFNGLQPQDIDTRAWNDWNDADTSIIYKVIRAGANPTIDLENIWITTQSSLYSPSFGANTEDLFGFQGRSPITLPSSEDGLQRTYESTSVPKMLATRTMFLRLENFTQECMNAFSGNRSNIIAHLPRFDGQVETGRIYHEPKNLIYLDLNNPAPMRVNSFDLSFVYTDEQYCDALIGQAVVVLYFRVKPSDQVQV